MDLSSSVQNGRGNYRALYQGQSIDDLIIKYMEENDIPGLSLAIVQAPYITRVVGYGFADITTKTLVSMHTLFHIGQLTHAFTAVAIMQLCETDQLRLDDLIIDYLDVQDVDNAWRTITIRDLLAHSSGLPSYTDSLNFNPHQHYSSPEIIALIKTRALLFPPGAKVVQSDTNHYLLGLIVEKASGQSYQDYVTQNQINRLSLKHTCFISQLEMLKNEAQSKTEEFKHSEFLHDPKLINPTEAAIGYSAKNSLLITVPTITWGASYASCGIASSAADISLWDIGLAGGILIKDPKNRECLYQSIKLNNDRPIPGHSSWLFPGHKGLMEIKGNIPGFSSFLSRFTAAQELICVTLLANKEGLLDLNILARKIAGAYNPKLRVPSGAGWSETIQSPYSVQYTIDRVERLITTHGGRVFARIDHAKEAKLAGKEMLDTQVLIFGNPSQGTEMMQVQPTMALDLPLKVMAMLDEHEQVWLSFTDPVLLAQEYHVNTQKENIFYSISKAIRDLCHKAISPDDLD